MEMAGVREMSLIYRWPLQDSAASRVLTETVVGTNGETKVTNTSVASVAGPGGLYPLAFNVAGIVDRSIKTPVLSVNHTPTISLAFWFRFTSIVSPQIIAELSSNFNNGTGLLTAIENTAGGELSAGVKKLGYNLRFYKPAPAINQWHHFCCLFDFTQAGGNPALQGRLFVNGVEPALHNGFQYHTQNTGNFVNQPLFLGARNQYSAPAFGAYAGFHMYDHRLTAGEIDDLITEGTASTIQTRRRRSLGGFGL